MQGELIERRYPDLQTRVAAQIDDAGPWLVWEAFRGDSPSARWAGTVGWDGSLTVHDDSDTFKGCHFASLDELKELGELAQQLYKLAAEIVPGWHS